jgi:uncharacterized protein YidB (DUF937 family)
MGLLDQVLGSMLGGDRTNDVSPGQASGLAQAVVSMLADPRAGGLDGLLRQFGQNGLGDVASSWVGTGQNQPISPDALSRTLGQERVTQISQQANVPPAQAPSLLAQLVPVLIDQLTPHGRVPDQGQLSQTSSDLLRSLLAGRAG